MKITVEQIDQEIKKIRSSPINLENEGIFADISLYSEEFNLMVKAILILNNTISNSIQDTVINSLLQGIKIGYHTAITNIEIQQLEEICGIVEDGDH